MSIIRRITTTTTHKHTLAREELWPLPDEEMPEDREWTSTEWQRNQRYIMNLLIDSLEEENAILCNQVRAMERVASMPPAVTEREPLPTLCSCVHPKEAIMRPCPKCGGLRILHQLRG